MLLAGSDRESLESQFWDALFDKGDHDAGAEALLTKRTLATAFLLPVPQAVSFLSLPKSNGLLRCKSSMQSRPATIQQAPLL
jgi:hypothetical protein